MACSRIMNGIHAQHALHCVACTLESPSIECVFKIHVQVHALTIVKAVLWRIKILRVMSESFSLQNYRLPVGTKPPSNLTKSKAWSKDKKRLRPGSTHLKPGQRTLDNALGRTDDHGRLCLRSAISANGNMRVTTRLLRSMRAVSTLAVALHISRCIIQRTEADSISLSCSSPNAGSKRRWALRESDVRRRWTFASRASPYFQPCRSHAEQWPS
jgi:hypothetical protein